MSQAVTNFYLFIKREHNIGEGNFNQLKSLLDKDGNNVIEIGELRGFINTQKQQCPGDVFLRQINNGDINEIWNELDNVKCGDNSYASGGRVSENGSLNATEEKGMKDRIKLYGKIDEAIEKALQNLGWNSDLKIGQGHEYEVQIKLNDIYYRAADELVGTVGSANINQLVNDGDLGNKAIKAVKTAAAKLIKEQLIEKYQQQLVDKVPNGYSLDDKDLGPVLSAKIEELVNSSGAFNLNNVDQQIAYIIRGYMDSARITNYGQYSTPWEGTGLNTLQKARLEQEYRTALTIDKVNTENQFNGFTDVLQTAINNFIDKEIEGLENPTEDFNTLLDQAQNSINTFKKSPQFKVLSVVVDISKAKALDNNGELNIGNSDNQTPQQRMVAIVEYFAGCLDKEDLNRLMNSQAYKDAIKAAYIDILANPEEYGVDTNLTSDKLTENIQNAVLKYIKEHLSDILQNSGCIKASGESSEEKEFALALYYNFQSSYNFANNEHGSNSTITQNTSYGNGVYGIEEVRAAAWQFVQFVALKYTDSSVQDALEQEYDGYSLDTGIDKMSIDNIKQAIEAVMKAIQNVKPNGSPNQPDPPGPTGNDFDNIDNPLGSGRTYLKDSLSDSFYNWGGDLRSVATGKIDEMIGTIVLKLAENENIDRNKLTTAADNVKNYYKALISQLKFDDNNGEQNYPDTKTITYSYTDKDGNTTTETEEVGYRYCSDWHKDDADQNAQTSASGVYFLEHIRVTGTNTGTIAFDNEKIWQKFCEFYKKL